MMAIKNRLVAAMLIMIAVVGFAEEQPLLGPEVGFSDDRVPLFTVVPEYPEKARQERIEGEVKVCFDINRDGKTYRLAVRNSTHRIFEKPSLKAIRASTYKPLPKDAVVPGIKSCRTFHFFLEPVAIDKPDSVVGPAVDAPSSPD
jgi:TonB family protein